MFKKNKIIFELNEFSIDLLNTYKSTHKNIKKILDWHLIQTKIPDNYDSDFLEPWSQWVSIHTGIPCSIHQVKHLGDVELLEQSQAWDKNPEKFGIVWGCLNSKEPRDKIVKYFPDPWTKTSNTNIAGTKSLQNFLRLAVSGRGGNLFSRLKTLISLCVYGFFALPLLLINTDKEILRIVKKHSLRRILNVSVIYSIVEYIAFNIFLKSKRNNRNKIYTDVFFSNMLAHVQHYYWDTKNHYRIDFTMDIIDLMLGKLIQNYKKIFLINGLTQQYSADEEKWHSYIPKDGWVNFVRASISKKCNIEPCMSYDTNLIFSSINDLNEARALLMKIKICGTNQPIFLTEVNNKNHLKMFVRLNYYDHPNKSILINGKTLNFSDIFSLAAIRTARHIQLCNLLTNQKEIKNNKFVFNYDLFRIYE